MTNKTAKTTAILTMILLCFCTSEVKAQFELVLNSGITMPIEDKKTEQNILNTGYNFGAELTYPFENSKWRFGVDMNYFRSALSRRDDLNNSVLTAMGILTVVLPIDETASLIITGGFGMFRLHDEVLTIGFTGERRIVDRNETTAGFKIGAGLDMPYKRRYAIVLKVQYLIGTINHSFNTLIPITVGWKFKL